MRDRARGPAQRPGPDGWDSPAAAGKPPARSAPGEDRPRRLLSVRQASAGTAPAAPLRQQLSVGLWAANGKGLYLPAVAARGKPDEALSYRSQLDSGLLPARWQPTF